MNILFIFMRRISVLILNDRKIKFGIFEDFFRFGFFFEDFTMVLRSRSKSRFSSKIIPRSEMCETLLIESH